MHIFETAKPLHATIARYVQYYYQEINEANTCREFSCFPHYNNSISLYRSHSSDKKGTITYVANGSPLQIFTPVRQQVLTIKQMGPIHRVVLVFHPLGIQQFYKNLAFTKLMDDYEFFAVDELQQLFEAGNIHTITYLLDQYLLKRFEYHENKVLAQAIAYIHERAQTFSVETLSEELAISRRHINRLFQQQLGVSVKKFQEIVLFRQALEQKLFQNAEQNFTSLTYEMNLCDPSHLNKLFAKLTRIPPKQFVNKGTHLGQEDTFWHIN